MTPLFLLGSPPVDHQGALPLPHSPFQNLPFLKIRGPVESTQRCSWHSGLRIICAPSDTWLFSVSTALFPVQSPFFSSCGRPRARVKPVHPA